MRFTFLELPGDRAPLTRPVVPVQVEDLEEAPQLCLVDTAATTNRFGSWLAEAIGVDLSAAPQSTVTVGGLRATARHSRVDLTIAGVRYNAPVTFCDPWPFAFNLLGQEGFLRFFRVTLCAADSWLEIEPEPAAGHA
jgi:Aspartyl protease